MAKGDFRLFLLRDNPMKSVGEFAHGLDNDFDGIEIHLTEGVTRNSDKSKGATSRVHHLDVKINDHNKETTWNT